LHVDEPSPHVDWSAGAVELLTEARPWVNGSHPRRAGVSSFGISGTNAHVIVEEAPAEDGPVFEPEVQDGPLSWVVSAKTVSALRAQAARLHEHVVSAGDVVPADVAWSLVTSRSVFEHRAVVTGTGREGLLAGLQAVAEGVPASGVSVGAAAGPGAGVVFVFPGQGSQWAGMGAGLLQRFPVFAQAFDQVCDLVEAELGFGVRDVVLSGGDRVDQTVFAQAGLFAVLWSRCRGRWCVCWPRSGCSRMWWWGTRLVKGPRRGLPGCCRWRTRHG
jgi:acyl transferase domain-containing protein